MKFRANKMLGLAIGERSILVAEVAVNDERLQVLRTGEFAYAGDADLQHPESLGKSLSAFLKHEGFLTHVAVVGIPAKWVLSKNKDLPPVDPSLATDLIRMQIESEFSVEIKDLVHDYAGQSSVAEASSVLLAATPRRHIEQVENLADAARLHVHAITPTSIALTNATTSGTSDVLVLSITPSGAELAAQRGASPSLLRHVGAASAPVASVAGEVRRAALLMPRSNAASTNGQAGNSANGKSGAQIVVWDDAGLDAAGRIAYTTALGSGARAGELSALGAGEMPAGMRGFAAPIALAIAGVAEERLPIDFLHPRLAPPKKAALPRQTVLGIITAVIVVLGIIVAVADMHRLESELKDEQAKLEHDKDKRKTAEANVEMIKFAKAWHADKPRYLACLRDLTVVIPDDGHMFVTSLTLKDTMKGAVAGKCDNGQRALNLGERLKASKQFSDVKTLFETHTGREGTETSFSVTFKYLPHE